VLTGPGDPEHLLLCLTERPLEGAEASAAYLPVSGAKYQRNSVRSVVREIRVVRLREDVANLTLGFERPPVQI
jgi:hypothetical protein